MADRKPNTRIDLNLKGIMMYDLSKLFARKKQIEKCNSYTNNTLKSIWDVFDKIVCIHYLPYTNRIEPIKKELKRVGILDLPQFEWYYTVDNDFYQFILSGIDKDKLGYDLNFGNSYVSESNINYTIDSLSLLKMLNHGGYKRVLILEDDLNMIDDLTTLNDIINDIPQDFDFINFDPLYLRKTKSDQFHLEHLLKTMLYENKHGKKYYKFNSQPEGVFVYQTSMIALSGRFIDDMIHQLMKKLKPFDHYGINDFGDSNIKFNRYVTTKNVGYQKYYENAQDVREDRYGLQTNKLIPAQSKIVTYIQYYKPYENMVFYTIYTLCKQGASHIVLVLPKSEQAVIERVTKMVSKFRLTKITFQIMDDLYKFDLIYSNQRKFDYSALYRLFIPFLDTFKESDYSIYIDTDVYISKLYNEIECVNSVYEINHNFILAGRKSVEEKQMIPRDYPTIVEYSKYLTSLGKMVFGEYYDNILTNDINSGVLVFNNRNIDVNEYKDMLYFVLCRYVEILKTKPQSEWFKYPDQDIINMVFDNISILDKSYNWKQWWYQKQVIELSYENVTSKYLDSICSEQNICIMHFQGNQQGRIKPALTNAIKSDESFNRLMEEL